MSNLTDELLLNFHKTFNKFFPSTKGQKSEEQRVLKQLVVCCLFFREENFENFDVSKSPRRNAYYKEIYVESYILNYSILSVLQRHVSNLRKTLILVSEGDIFRVKYILVLIHIQMRKSLCKHLKQTTYLIIHLFAPFPQGSTILYSNLTANPSLIGLTIS